MTRKSMYTLSGWVSTISMAIILGCVLIDGYIDIKGEFHYLLLSGLIGLSAFWAFKAAEDSE